MNWQKLENKKSKLDRLRPLSKELLKNLEDWFRVELTYTSNAIEGNTLTRQETALVLTKGITVGGKTLQEHLEATNHAKAYDFILSLIAKKPYSISEKEILEIHSLVLHGIDDKNAGYYRNVNVRISGSRVILPNPLKISDHMQDFIKWLKKNNCHPVELAALAHYKLVTIHPFIDGNGRTARLLMNLILLMCGYPPSVIRKRDRLAYITSLEEAQLGGSLEKYLHLIFKSVDRSLDIYLQAVTGKQTFIEKEDLDLLKIGQLAKALKETVPTIRHWTQLGLLEVLDKTESGYQLYSRDMIVKGQKIQNLKKQRRTLLEIKNEL